MRRVIYRWIRRSWGAYQAPVFGRPDLHFNHMDEDSLLAPAAENARAESSRHLSWNSAGVNDSTKQ